MGFPIGTIPAWLAWSPGPGDAAVVGLYAAVAKTIAAATTGEKEKSLLYLYATEHKRELFEKEWGNFFLSEETLNMIKVPDNYEILYKIQGFLKVFNTPVIKATYKNTVLEFFTISQYNKWKEKKVDYKKSF